MNIYFNTATIFDLVVDEMLSKRELLQIKEQMELDNSAGKYATLLMSEEFMTSLEEQLA
jgi:hypothetical protein